MLGPRVLGGLLYTVRPGTNGGRAPLLSMGHHDLCCQCREIICIYTIRDTTISVLSIFYRQHFSCLPKRRMIVLCCSSLTLAVTLSMAADASARDASASCPLVSKRIVRPSLTAREPNTHQLHFCEATRAPLLVMTANLRGEPPRLQPNEC